MKTKFNEDIDIKIKKCLKDNTEGIKADDNMFFKVRAEIMKKNERKFRGINLGLLKAKTIVIAGVIFVLSSMACVAGTNSFYWSTSSSYMTEIKEFPSEKTVKKAAGFTPKYVDSFDGGFKFDVFNHSNDSLENEDTHDTIVKLKTADFYYNRENSKENQTLSMNARQIDEQYFNNDISVVKGEITEYKGVKIYYHKSKHKSVPLNYVKTEEDMKQEEEGTLSFGFGDECDEIEESNLQGVTWYEDGIKYSIFNSNYDDIGQEEMVKMAKKVIDK